MLRLSRAEAIRIIGFAALHFWGLSDIVCAGPLVASPDFKSQKI